MARLVRHRDLNLVAFPGHGLFDGHRAYGFFGDRVGESDLQVDHSFIRSFALPEDFDWLPRMCAPLKLSLRA